MSIAGVKVWQVDALIYYLQYIASRRYSFFQKVTEQSPRNNGAFYTYTMTKIQIEIFTGNCKYMLRLLYLNGYVIGPHHDQTPIQILWRFHIVVW